MELFKANQQWSTRPADERFNSLQALYDSTKHYADIARSAKVRYEHLRVEADNREVYLTGKSGTQARFTNWAFGQLCTSVGAPSGYLRRLPATLACQNLNHGLANRGANASQDANLLVHINGSMVLRAITSDRYERIWNHEVAERLLELESTGKWEPARPDFRVFMGDAPALYASDHDMFAFMRSTTMVEEAGANEPLRRGVIVENSEVGASALKLTRFLYRKMCGNHIIWGASNVMEISLRHVGNIHQRWQQFTVKAKAWMDESASLEEARIKWARETRIAATKEEVLDAIFGRRGVKLSKEEITQGYDSCRESEDGAPNTVWGLVQGLTRHSQTMKHTDTRHDLDKRAGKLMDIEF